jgi:hypothetical protein
MQPTISLGTTTPRNFFHLKELTVKRLKKAVLVFSLLLATGHLAAKQEKEDQEIPVPKNAKGLIHKPLKLDKSDKKQRNELKSIYKNKFKQSLFVVHAKVSGLEYGQSVNADNETNPVTYVVLDIIESLKGKFNTSQAVLGFTQGPIEGSRDEFVFMEGLPIFGLGDEVILFLTQDGDHLNPVTDSDVLFVHQNFIYAQEGNPLVGDASDSITHGKREKIPAIQTRNLNFNGHSLEIDSSDEFDPGENDPSLKKLEKMKFFSILKSGEVESDQIFPRTVIHGFEKTNAKSPKDVAPQQ